MHISKDDQPDMSPLSIPGYTIHANVSRSLHVAHSPILERILHAIFRCALRLFLRFYLLLVFVKRGRILPLAVRWGCRRQTTTEDALESKSVIGVIIGADALRDSITTV